MKKFENVDIKYALENIMNIHTKHFREDFDIDIKILSEFAQSDDPRMRHILWMSRPSGTHCLLESEVYLDGSRANHTWRFYDEQTRDKILSYVITLDKSDGETLTGDLFELDYPEHVARLKDLALPIHYLTTVFEDGTEYRRLKSEKETLEGKRLAETHGKVAYFKDEPEYEGELKRTLDREHLKRNYNAEPYDIDQHLAELEDAEFISAVTDPTVTIRDMHLYGYHYTNMIPTGKKKALELHDSGYQIYLLFPDDGEDAAISRSEILNHDGLFGCEKDGLDKRLSHEKAGIHDELALPGNDSDDTFSIYQLKDSEDTREYRWEHFDRLKSRGFSVRPENYEHIYTAVLDRDADLESIFSKFNVDIPDGFIGHSLTVSDIIVLKKNGILSAHYVDNTGFALVPEFLEKNYLKNAELDTEQNFDMVDGILNNQPRDEIEKRGTGSPICAMKGYVKPSVIDRLKTEKENLPPKAKEQEQRTKAPEIERF